MIPRAVTTLQRFGLDIQPDMLFEVQSRPFYSSGVLASLLTRVKCLIAVRIANHGAPSANADALSMQAERCPLREDFQCPVCLQLLDRPVVLTCGHAFCQPCLAGVEAHGGHACAMCRKAHPPQVPFAGTVGARWSGAAHALTRFAVACILVVSTLLDQFIAQHFADEVRPTYVRCKLETYGILHSGRNVPARRSRQRSSAALRDQRRPSLPSPSTLTTTVPSRWTTKRASASARSLPQRRACPSLSR
jgi:hypothetical protein